MGLTMSLSGMFNTGHDVGGFNGPVPEPELLVRWVQNGVFSPRFIMNSWKSGGEVNTPWLHPEAIAPIRAAIRFRYRLMPYLYTLYRRAHERGEPILRPLCYEFEHDPRAYADCDDFMFGPQLLVANVVERGARERRVYLPTCDAGWYDFYTGEHHAGGRDIVVPAPLDHIPLFARAGAIIPMTGRDDFALLHDEPSRQLRIFAACGRIEHPIRSVRGRRQQHGLPRRRLCGGRHRNAYHERGSPRYRRYLGALRITLSSD